MEFILYSFLVFLAGLFDAVIGGGGLITIPVLTMILNSSAQAIGTNKVLALATSMTALYFYHRRHKLTGQFPWATFGLILIGTLAGASLQKYFPENILKFVFLFIAPLVLFFVFNKKIWMQKKAVSTVSKSVFIILSFLCGFYDGAFGPGSGILFFILFLWLESRELIEALLMAKIASIISSFLALLSYSAQGLVHWSVGLKLSMIIVLGTLIGVFAVNRHAEKIVKPALLIVVFGLMIKIYLLN